MVGALSSSDKNAGLCFVLLKVFCSPNGINRMD